jgi:conjugal transfer mating pair stabilization protein TraN
VGDYCSNKSLFGICLQRTMSYCCFQGSLARIINEAGRPQVGKVWGNPKGPDCSGFTVAQFQTLDLSHVDFSEFYNQALGGLNVPSSASATSNIQATLQQMQSGNTPSTLSSSGP